MMSAAWGVTAAVAAVMPTRPASRPLPVMATSGLPVLIQIVAMAVSAPAQRRRAWS